MSLTTPTYDIGDTVYLRDSAALGFIEALIVQGIVYNAQSSAWVYQLSINLKPQTSAAQTIGDRIIGVSAKPVFVFEHELATQCEAIDLAIDNLEQQLSTLRARKLSLCE